MSVVDRRHFLRGYAGNPNSPASFGRPAAFPLQPFALASTTTLRAPKTAPLCNDLLSAANDGLGHAAIRYIHKGATSSDFLNASRKLKLLGHHLQDVGADEGYRSVAKLTDPASIDFSSPAYSSGLLSALQQYDSTLTLADLPPLGAPSFEEVNSVFDDLKVTNVSTRVLDMAGSLQILSQSGILAELQKAELLDPPSQGLHLPAAQLIQASYHPSFHGAHLQYVCEHQVTITRKQICDWMKWPLLYWATFAGLMVFACLVPDPATPELCSLMATRGWKITAALVALISKWACL